MNDAGERWLARAAPLFDEPPADPPELRDRLALLAELRSQAPAAIAAETDRDLLERAVRQLDGVEDELRSRLARTAPGDPEGRVDRDRLEELLSEREARAEIGLPADLAPVELTLSGPNYATAGFMGIFGLGWTAFTTIHAFFMIGALFKAFGWPVLFLLLFYAIFWAVGFGVLSTAIASLATETIRLNGLTLEIVRRGPLGTRTRVVRLDPATRSRNAVATTWRQSGQPAPRAIELTDVEGRPVNFGGGATVERREDAMRRIDAHLEAHHPARRLSTPRLPPDPEPIDTD